jgi:hypothetical protein
MKISEVLTVCFVLCCFFTSNVFGQEIVVENECQSGLLDVLSPNGGTYFQGDPICYEVSVQIPDDPAFCTYENFEVYFFAPDNPPNAPDACDADNGVLIISEPIFGPGSFASVDCDNPALSYIVSLADVVNGNELKAQICTKFTLDGNPDSDSKTVTNFVEVNPCIDIAKEACPYSKVGDEVVYTITIENCGDVDLQILSLEDSLLPLDPFLCGPVLPVGAVCVFEVPYIVQPGDLDPLINQVTVTALPFFDDGVIIVTEEVSDTAEAEVDLLHPELEVDVQCVTNGIPVPGGPETIGPVPGGLATFEVCVRNTGDVALDIQQSDCLPIGPLPIPPTLEPGGVVCVVVEVPVDV